MPFDRRSEVVLKVRRRTLTEEEVQIAGRSGQQKIGDLLRDALTNVVETVVKFENRWRAAEISH